MATVKVKFRASSVESKEGTLFYQVIHNRVSRQVRPGYKLYPSEWETLCSGTILPPDTDNPRHRYLVSLKDSLKTDLARLKNIIGKLECAEETYTADKVVEIFSILTNTGGIHFVFPESCRTIETYREATHGRDLHDRAQQFYTFHRR